MEQKKNLFNSSQPNLILYELRMCTEVSKAYAMYVLTFAKQDHYYIKTLCLALPCFTMLFCYWELSTGLDGCYNRYWKSISVIFFYPFFFTWNCLFSKLYRVRVVLLFIILLFLFIFFSFIILPLLLLLLWCDTYLPMRIHMYSTLTLVYWDMRSQCRSKLPQVSEVPDGWWRTE